MIQVLILATVAIVIGILGRFKQLPKLIIFTLVCASLLLTAISLTTVTDNMSRFFSYMFLLFSSLVLIYSFAHNYSTRFYSLVMFSLAGLVGLSLTKDLFLFFIFWELMTLPSFVLVLFSPYVESREAALKYLIMAAIGGTLILFGIGFYYGFTGTLEFNALKSPHSWIPFLFLFAGFGVKAGVFPFNLWMPDVYQSTSDSVAAFLSGITSKAGSLAMLKLLFMLVSSSDFALVAFFAILTMTIANLSALLQNDLRRLFAFSSISHLSYILLAFSTITSLGMQSGVFHVFNHASVICILFMSLGVLSSNRKNVLLKNLRGIVWQSPWVGLFFVVGVLGAIGFPSTSTFMSEFQIMLAILRKSPPLAVAMVLNIVISAAYYLRVLQYTVFEKHQKTKVNVHILAFLPMLILAGLIIVIGIYPAPVIDIIQELM